MTSLSAYFTALVGLWVRVLCYGYIVLCWPVLSQMLWNSQGHSLVWKRCQSLNQVTCNWKPHRILLQLGSVSACVLTWGKVWFESVVSQLAPGTFCLRLPWEGTTGRLPCPSFYVGVRDPVSSPHTCPKFHPLGQPLIRVLHFACPFFLALLFKC